MCNFIALLLTCIVLFDFSMFLITNHYHSVCAADVVVWPPASEPFLIRLSTEELDRPVLCGLMPTSMPEIELEKRNITQLFFPPFSSLSFSHSRASLINSIAMERNIIYSHALIFFSYFFFYYTILVWNWVNFVCSWKLFPCSFS